MSFRKFTLACTLACGVLGAAVGAGEPPYVNGGVGLEERSALQAQKADYNLHMTFANRGSGEFRSDVQVTIADHKGNVALNANDAGPLLMVKLDPGQYRVTATAMGQMQSKNVTLHAGRAAELYFYWQDGSPDDQ